MFFSKESTNFEACFTLSKRIMSITETQQALAFAAMCVDLTAQAEGCSRREMYERMKKFADSDILTEKALNIKRIAHFQYCPLFNHMSMNLS